MEAKAKSFGFISNEAIVTIPFFQRNYVWQKTNWEDLLSDLKDLEKNHFLGSLILKQQPARSGEPREVLVIDGQQRLTTISLLLKALYDSFSEEIKDTIKDDIRSHLFYKKNRMDKNYFVKIHHSHHDAKSFNQIIKHGIDTEGSLLADPKNRILSCYHYYAAEFAQMLEEHRKSIFSYVLDSENKIVVVIDLQQEDDEQAIFDTINSAGVRLSPADIIKNALFQKAISLESEATAISLYNETWNNIFITNDLVFWEMERSTGRLTRNNLELLLHAVAVIKGFYDPEKDTLADLSKLYKKKIDMLKSFEELQVFAFELKKYGEIYKDKMLVFGNYTLFSFDNIHQRIFHILNVLDISTFHPFLLFLYNKFEVHESQLFTYLNQLGSFVVRRVISGSETKSFNKLTKELIENPFLLSEKLLETTDDEFVNGLKNISNKNASFLLFWIELYRRYTDKFYGQKELKYAYTLEHIMPQKWEEHWAVIPNKKDAEENDLNMQAVKDDRLAKIYWIGNMTLLTSSLNTSLRNFEYNRKMEGEGRKKGIKHYNELSITNHDLVVPYDKGDKEWSEEKIISRTKQLTEEALKIWGI